MSTKEETFPILQAENIYIGGVGSIAENCACLGKWAYETIDPGVHWYGTPTHHPFGKILMEELDKRGLVLGDTVAGSNDGPILDLRDKKKVKLRKQLLADAWNAAGYRYGFNELP